jgi:hypothetical protein
MDRENDVFKLKSWIDKTKVRWNLVDHDHYTSELSIEPDRVGWLSISRNPSPEAIRLLMRFPDKIKWFYLSRNPGGIKLLEENERYIDWSSLSMNPNAIHLLERNPDKIDWCWLSSNPNAIHLLEQNLDKVDWKQLSGNPNAIHILERNQDKIYWPLFSVNRGIFEYDYDFLRERISVLRDELLSVTLHPDRIADWDKKGFHISDLFVS